MVRSTGPMGVRSCVRHYLSNFELDTTVLPRVQDMSLVTSCEGVLREQPTGSGVSCEPGHRHDEEENDDEGRVAGWATQLTHPNDSVSCLMGALTNLLTHTILCRH